MEFPFNVINLFGDGTSEICLVDRRLIPANDVSHRKPDLCKVIDEMGRASAKAQSLHGPITNASKLAVSRHNLYIKIDLTANSGDGSVVGFLKTGNKKLFIYDRHGNQHEMEPLCVLDFYVHESCQRHGYGKQLFQEMLRREGVQPSHLAIDRPSAKFLSFLEKHYGLRSAIPQVNNFVIFDGFFREKSALNSSRRRSDVKPSMNELGHYSHQENQRGGGVNRYLGRVRSNPASERRLTSAQSADILPLSRQPSDIPQQQPRNLDACVKDIPLRTLEVTVASPVQSRPTSRKLQQTLGMGAQLGMYSRHQVGRTPSPLQLDRNATSDTIVSSHVASPPTLRRDGPSKDYLQLLNNSNSYLDRRGRLITPVVDQSTPASTTLPATTAINNNNNTTHNALTGAVYAGINRTPWGFNLRPSGARTDIPCVDPYSTHIVRNPRADTTWNIFGVPKSPARTAIYTPADYVKKNQKTSLW